MGGNFAQASPDTAMTHAALRRCRLSVQVSTKLNRSHLVTGDEALILPCLARTDRDVQAGGRQFVTVENSMGVVHPSEGSLKPHTGTLRSEPAIVAGLGDALFGRDDVVPWLWLAEDYARVRDTIEQVVPGFERYDQRIRAEGSLVLPNPARERRFLTATGRARFTVHPVPRNDLAPGELLMMTVRSHDQFNTTIYGLDDRYRGIRGDRMVVFMHAADADAAGVTGVTGDERVALVSRYGGVERRVAGFRVVPCDVPRGTAVTYFPEANPLVPIEHHAARSFTPASKSVVVRVERQPELHVATTQADVRDARDAG